MLNSKIRLRYIKNHPRHQILRTEEVSGSNGKIERRLFNIKTTYQSVNNAMEVNNQKQEKSKREKWAKNYTSPETKVEHDSWSYKDQKVVDQKTKNYIKIRPRQVLNKLSGTGQLIQ